MHAVIEVQREVISFSSFPAEIITLLFMSASITESAMQKSSHKIYGRQSLPCHKQRKVLHRNYAFLVFCRSHPCHR